MPTIFTINDLLVNCLRRFNVYDAGCLLHCNMPKLALQLIWWYNSYAQFKVWVLSGLILNDRNDCLWGTRKTWNGVEARQTQNSYGFWISCRDCTKFSHNSNFDKPSDEFALKPTLLFGNTSMLFIPEFFKGKIGKKGLWLNKELKIK